MGPTVFALVMLAVAVVAYLITLQGPRVTYIVPLSVEEEVAIGLGFLVLALAGVFVSVSALIFSLFIPTIISHLMMTILAVGLVWRLRRTLLTRYRTDAASVRSRRAATN
jgi:hypothetical protein